MSMRAVVVDQRHEKHEHDADGKEADLLGVEAVELGVEGGGFDLKDADDGEDGDKGEQDPVEVAKGGEAGHGASLERCDSGGNRCGAGGMLETQLSDLPFELGNAPRARGREPRRSPLR